MAVGYLGGPQVECFIGHAVIAGVVQRLSIAPERGRAPSRRMRAATPSARLPRPPSVTMNAGTPPYATM